MEIENPIISGRGSISGIFGTTRPWINNPDNDNFFEASGDDGQGLLRATGEISGTLYTGNFGEGVITGYGEISGEFLEGTVFPGRFDVLARISGTFEISYKRQHWVGWSKIGDTRIRLDSSNEAGYMPLPGSAAGLVHAILPMNVKIPVVYSTEGIFQLTPVSSPFTTFGRYDISPLGIYGRGAVCGTDRQHFYINKQKQLCEVRMGEYRPEVTVLGYEEFIKALTPGNSPVLLHMDAQNARMYISSATGGLIYTPAGLGGGYAKLTHADGQYYAATGPLMHGSQEVVTDVLDFKYRGMKSLENIEFGVDIPDMARLSVAVDYRYDKSRPFRTSPWKRLNKEGVVFPMLSFLEARIRIRTMMFTEFHLDYMILHYKFVDSRYTRSGYVMNRPEAAAE